MLIAATKDVNQIPEAMRSHYKQGADGVWRLDVAPAEGFALENIQGLKNALDSERTKAAELAGKLKAWDGLDRGQVDRDLEAFKAMEGAVPKDKVEAMVQKKLADAQAGWQTKLESATGEAQKLHGLLDAQAKRGGIVNALQKARLNPILADHLAGMVTVKRGEDGINRTLELVDPVTNLPPLGNDGKPMTLEMKTAAMAADPNYAQFVMPNPASGPGFGTPPGGRLQGGAGPSTPPSMLADKSPDSLGANLEALAEGRATFQVDQS